MDVPGTLRQDYYLYNEANGWILTSAGRNGLDEGLETGDWEREFDRGTFIPVALYQDDSLVVRVLLNEELSDQEDGEWVDRFAWKLAVPDGKLVLAAGSEYLDDPEELEPASLRVLPIPPGDYRVEVYTCAAGVNGGDPPGESWEQFWKRTRGRAKRPAWISGEAEDDETLAVDFLARLTRLAGEPERPPLEGGWVPVSVARRMPEACPRGLAATVAPPEPEAPEDAPTGLRYVHNVPELVAGLEPAAISGGPVEVPLERLVLPYWIAWFCGETHPYVRVFDCPAPPLLEWPGVEQGIQATATEDGWRVDIEGMYARWSQFGHLRQLGAVLSGLPEGAGLELAAASNDGEDEDGVQRYVGRVRDGCWRIEETYPAVDRDTLAAMLSLAAETDAGQGILARDREEIQAIMKAASRDSVLKPNPPRIRNGSFIMQNAAYYPFLAGYIYFRRFGGVWPALNRFEELDEWDDLVQGVERAGAAHATGELVFEGRFARFCAADLMALPDLPRERVEAAHAALCDLGLELLGDLNTDKTFQAVFRGYALRGAPAFASIISAGHGNFTQDFYTVFPDGFSLTTTAGDGFQRDRRQKTYHLLCPGDPEERLKRHLDKIRELAETHGPAAPVEPTLAAFAAAVDDFLARTQ